MPLLCLRQNVLLLKNGASKHRSVILFNFCYKWIVFHLWLLYQENGILFLVLQHAILVERKETIDLTDKGNKFYLQENSDEYSGHDLISFPRLYYM